MIARCILDNKKEKYQKDYKQNYLSINNIKHILVKLEERHVTYRIASQILQSLCFSGITSIGYAYVQNDSQESQIIQLKAFLVYKQMVTRTIQ